MKSIIKIYDMKNTKDVSNIKNAIASNEGVIACKVSLGKKEAQIIYNENYVKIEDIIDSIENLGYMII